MALFGYTLGSFQVVIDQSNYTTFIGTQLKILALPPLFICMVGVTASLDSLSGTSAGGTLFFTLVETAAAGADMQDIQANNTDVGSLAIPAIPFAYPTSIATSYGETEVVGGGGIQLALQAALTGSLPSTFQITVRVDFAQMPPA